MPAAFHVSPDVPEADRVTWHAAAAAWNDALGTEVFIEDAPDDGCGIYIVPATDYVIDTTHIGNSYGVSMCRMNVMLRPGMDVAKAMVSATHELGHTLSLHHSEDEASVMFKNYKASANQRITAHDIAKAKERL
jgi:predicted Zn-dependent protease